jgi:hypothetical protein
MMIDARTSPSPVRHLCGAARHGMVLPFVLVMVSVVLTLGVWYLFSTVQSKNVFQVFYWDDLARVVAQSAMAEWRASFNRRLENQPALKTLIESPGAPGAGPVPFALADVPATQEMVGRIIGGQATIAGTVEVRQVDSTLIETMGGTSRRSAFAGEYQASLVLTVRVTIGRGGGQRQSVFREEYDLKRLCLRSRPNDRRNSGYTSTATNDYVLFIRDSYGEFNDFNGRSLNNNDRSLLLSHADPTRKGKIFLGCARPADADQSGKYVYLNVNERMASLIPAAPSPIEIPWDTLKQAHMMPNFSTEIQRVLDQAQRDADGQVNFFPERIKATIVVDYRPLVPDQNIFQIMWARVVELFNHFFNKMANTREGNKEKGIHLLGDQNMDPAMCALIEGNVRQRFWQTATFKLDLSQVSDNAQVNDAIRTQHASKLELDLKYFTPSEIDLMLRTGTDEQAKEVYKVVKFYQDRDRTQLMSMPNDMFPLRQGVRYDTDRNSPGTFPDPPFHGRTGPVDFVDFLPYAAFLTRAHRFATSQALYQSPFYDPRRNVLTLSGVFMIADEANGLVVRSGLKYEGKGVLLSYGNVVIEGSFEKNNADAGPCVIYTYDGTIKANAHGEGRVEASLIALHWRYNPTSPTSPRGMVDFSGRRCNVLGNLVADRLNLTSMAANQANRVEYDSSALNGGPLYKVSVGGRLRSLRMIHDATPP